MSLSHWQIDKSWTVFLDRDGVINKKIEDDYVRHLSMFEWLPGAKEAIVKLSKLFGRVIIITNQQGVGKGLMSEKDVQVIHDFLVKEIHLNGGRIDKIYFAPQLQSENHPERKPGIGMVQKAKKDFPEIDFSKSIIIGDSRSDMELGEKAGMKKIFIGDRNKIKDASVITPDECFDSLLKAVNFLAL